MYSEQTINFASLGLASPENLQKELSSLGADNLDPEFFKHLEVYCKRIGSIPIDQPCWSALVRTIVKLTGAQILQKEKFVPIVKVFQSGLTSKPSVLLGHVLWKCLIIIISKVLVQETKDRRAGAFLRQRISFAIQRGNVASSLSTLPQSSNPNIRHITWSTWLYLSQHTLSYLSTETYSPLIMKLLVLPLNKVTHKVIAEPHDFIQLKIEIVKEFLKVCAFLNFDASYRIIETTIKLFYGPEIATLCYSEDICQQITQLYLDMLQYSETSSCTVLLTNVIDKVIVCLLHSMSPGVEREKLLLSVWNKACHHFKDVRCPTLYMDTVKSEMATLYGRFSSLLSNGAPSSPGSTVNRDFIPMKMISTLAVAWELTGKRAASGLNIMDETYLPRNLEPSDLLEMVQIYIKDHEESKYLVYLLPLLCHGEFINGNDTTQRTLLLLLKNKIRSENVTENLFSMCLDILEQVSPISSSLVDVWTFLVTYYTELVSDDVIKLSRASSNKEQGGFRTAHRLLLFPLNSSWNEKVSKVWRKMYAGLSNSAALDPMTRDWDFPSSLLSKVGTAGTQEEARAHMLFTMLTHSSTSGYKEISKPVQDALVSLIQSTAAGSTLDAVSTLCFSCVAKPSLVSPLVTQLSLRMTDHSDVLDFALSTKIIKLQRDLKQHRQSEGKPVTAGSKPVVASPRTSSRFLHKLSQQQQQESKVSKITPPSPVVSKVSKLTPASPKPNKMDNSKLNSSVHEEGDTQDYVFIPPSSDPSILPLTQHQKEKLKSRPSDIPALYQDLSQGSMNSQDVNSQDSFVLVTPLAINPESKTKSARGSLDLDENAMDLFTPTPTVLSTDETQGTTPAIEKTKGTTPVIEKINVATPVIEETKVATPVIEKTNVATPAIEKTNVATPVIEKTNVATPAIEKTNVATPVIEKTNVATPAIEKTNVATPVIEKTKFTTPVIEKIKFTTPAIEKINVAAIAAVEVEETLNEINIENQINKGGDGVTDEKVTTRRSLKRNADKDHTSSVVAADKSVRKSLGKPVGGSKSEKPGESNGPIKTRKSLASEKLKENSGERNSSPNKRKSLRKQVDEKGNRTEGDKEDTNMAEKDNMYEGKPKEDKTEKLSDEKKVEEAAPLRRSPRKSDARGKDMEEKGAKSRESVTKSILNEEKSEDEHEATDVEDAVLKTPKQDRHAKKESGKITVSEKKNDTKKDAAVTKDDVAQEKNTMVSKSAGNDDSPADLKGDILKTPTRQLSKRKCASPFNTKDFIIELTPKRRKSAPAGGRDSQGSQDSVSSSQDNSQGTNKDEPEMPGTKNSEAVNIKDAQQNDKSLTLRKSLSSIETRKSVGNKEMEKHPATKDSEQMDVSKEIDTEKVTKCRESKDDEPRKSILKGKTLKQSKKDDLSHVAENGADFVLPPEVMSHRGKRSQRKSILKLPRASDVQVATRKSVKFHARIARSNTTLEEERSLGEKILELDAKREEQEDVDKARKSTESEGNRSAKQDAADNCEVNVKIEVDSPMKNSKMEVKSEATTVEIDTKQNDMEDRVDGDVEMKEMNDKQEEISDERPKDDAEEYKSNSAVTSRDEGNKVGEITNGKEADVTSIAEVEKDKSEADITSIAEVEKDKSDVAKATCSTSPKKLKVDKDKQLTDTVDHQDKTILANKHVKANATIQEQTVADKSKRSHNVSRVEINIRKRTIQELYKNIRSYRSNEVNIIDLETVHINQDPLRAYERFKSQILYNTIKFLLSGNVIYAVTDVTLSRLFGPNSGLHQNNTIIGGTQHCTIASNTTMFNEMTTHANETTLGKTLLPNDKTYNETMVSMASYRQLNADTKLGSRCVTHMLVKKNDKNSFNFISNFSFILLSHSVDLNMAEFNLSHLWSSDKLGEILEYFNGLNSVPIFLTTVLTENKNLVDKKFKTRLADKLKRFDRVDDYFVKYLDYTSWTYSTDLPEDFNIYDEDTTLIRIENVKFNFYIAPGRDVNGTQCDTKQIEFNETKKHEEQEVVVTTELAAKKMDSPTKGSTNTDLLVKPTTQEQNSIAASHVESRDANRTAEPIAKRNNVDSPLKHIKAIEKVDKTDSPAKKDKPSPTELVVPETQQNEEETTPEKVAVNQNEKQKPDEKREESPAKRKDLESPAKSEDHDNVAKSPVKSAKVTEVPDTQQEEDRGLSSERDLSSEPSSLEVVESSQEISHVELKSPKAICANQNAKFVHSTPFPTKIVTGGNVLRPAKLSSSEEFNLDSGKSVDTLERAVIESASETSSKSIHSPRRSIDSPRVSRIFPPSSPPRQPIATPPRSPRKHNSDRHISEEHRRLSGKKTTPPQQLGGRGAAMLELLESGTSSGSLLKKRITPTRIAPGSTTPNSQSPPVESPKSSRRSSRMLSLVKSYATDLNEIPEDTGSSNLPQGPTTPRQTRWKEQQWTPGRTPIAGILRVFSSGKKKLKVNFMEHPVSEELHFDKSRETLNNSLHILYNSPYVVGKKLQFQDPSEMADDMETQDEKLAKLATREEKIKELKASISDIETNSERKRFIREQSVKEQNIEEKRERKSIDKQNEREMEVDHEDDVGKARDARVLDAMPVEKKYNPINEPIVMADKNDRIVEPCEIEVETRNERLEEQVEKIKGSNSINTDVQDKNHEETYNKKNEFNETHNRRNELNETHNETIELVKSQIRRNELDATHNETNESGFRKDQISFCVRETRFDSQLDELAGLDETSDALNGSFEGTRDANEPVTPEKSRGSSKQNDAETGPSKKETDTTETNENNHRKHENNKTEDNLETKQEMDSFADEYDETFDSLVEEIEEIMDSQEKVEQTREATMNGTFTIDNEEGEIDIAEESNTIDDSEKVDRRAKNKEVVHTLEKNQSPFKGKAIEKRSPVKVERTNDKSKSLHELNHKESPHEQSPAKEQHPVEQGNKMSDAPEKNKEKVARINEKQSDANVTNKAKNIDDGVLRRINLSADSRISDTTASTCSSLPGISLDVSSLALSYQSQSQGSLASQCGLLPTPPAHSPSLSALYPSLVSCGEEIDDAIMCALSQDAAQRRLLARHFAKLEIKTVGHLASLSRLQASNLPLGKQKENIIVAALKLYEENQPEQQLETRKEQQLEARKEQQLENRKEQQLENSKEQQLGNRKEQQLENNKEQQLGNNKEHQLETRKEQQLENRKEQQLENRKEQQVETRKEQQLESQDREQRTNGVEVNSRTDTSNTNAELESLAAQVNNGIELDDIELAEEQLEAQLELALSLTSRILEKRKQLKRKRREETGQDNAKRRRL